MYIHEAAKLALEGGRGIARSGAMWRKITVVPTNTTSCCIITTIEKGSHTIPRWVPKAEDLTANDWQVVG